MSELLQPHEGVAGIDRDDWLLDLDMRALPHRDALASVAYNLQQASLVGNPAPIVKRIWDRISKPKIGDLVVESTYWFPNRDEDHRAKSLGILVAKRSEWACSDDEWAKTVAEEDPEITAMEGRPIESDAWYIQYGSKAADICRWSNCTFIAIPTDHREFR